MLSDFSLPENPVWTPRRLTAILTACRGEDGCCRLMAGHVRRVASDDVGRWSGRESRVAFPSKHV